MLAANWSVIIPASQIRKLRLGEFQLTRPRYKVNNSESEYYSWVSPTPKFMHTYSSLTVCQALQQDRTNPG